LRTAPPYCSFKPIDWFVFGQRFYYTQTITAFGCPKFCDHVGTKNGKFVINAPLFPPWADATAPSRRGRSFFLVDDKSINPYCLRSSSSPPDTGGGGRAALLLPGMDLYSVRIVISSPLISSTFGMRRGVMPRKEQKKKRKEEKKKRKRKEKEEKKGKRVSGHTQTFTRGGRPLLRPHTDFYTRRWAPSATTHRFLHEEVGSVCDQESQACIVGIFKCKFPCEHAEVRGKPKLLKKCTKKKTLEQSGRDAASWRVAMNGRRTCTRGRLSPPGGLQSSPSSRYPRAKPARPRPSLSPPVEACVPPPSASCRSSAAPSNDRSIKSIKKEGGPSGAAAASKHASMQLLCDWGMLQILVVLVET